MAIGTPVPFDSARHKPQMWNTDTKEPEIVDPATMPWSGEAPDLTALAARVEAAEAAAGGAVEGVAAEAEARAAALEGKADAEATTEALAGKADAAATTEALEGKADAEATTEALAGKADAADTTAALAARIVRAPTDANEDPIDWTDEAIAGAPLVAVPGTTPQARPGVRVPLGPATVADIQSGAPGYLYVSPERQAQSEAVAEIGEVTGSVIIDAHNGINQMLVAAGPITIAGVINAVNGRRITIQVRAKDEEREVTFGGECQFSAAALPGGANPVPVDDDECFIFDILPNVESDGTRTTLIRNADLAELAALSAPVMQSVTITPAIGVVAGTFSIAAVATGNPAPTFAFTATRNKVSFPVTNNGNGTATLSLGGGQQGAIEVTAVATNSEDSSAPMTGYARAGRLIPSYVGETWAMRDMSSGSTDSEILLHENSEAGQMCFVDATFQALSNYAFPAGFSVVGYVDNANTATENHYRKGWAWKIIREADALAGKMLENDDETPLTLSIPSNSSFLTATIKDATSVDWDGTFTRSALAGANAVDLKTRNVLNCLLGISVASGSYNTHARTASALDYDLPAGLTNPAGGFTGTGRKGGRILWRPVGAGTLGAQVISTSGAATQTLTTATICFLADDD